MSEEFKKEPTNDDEIVRQFFGPKDLETAFQKKESEEESHATKKDALMEQSVRSGDEDRSLNAFREAGVSDPITYDSKSLFNSAVALHNKNTPVPVDMIKEIINTAKTHEDIGLLDELPDGLVVEMGDGEYTFLAELREKWEQSKENNIKINALFQSAQNREELESIIKSSELLEDGLVGSQDVYFKDDLLVLVDAIWKGEIAIDHLPRTCGFREEVYRIMRANQKKDLIPKPKTWDEMKETVPSHVHADKGLSNNYKDEKGDLVHEFDPNLTENIKPTEIQKGIFGSLVKRAKRFLGW